MVRWVSAVVAVYTAMIKTTMIVAYSPRLYEWSAIDDKFEGKEFQLKQDATSLRSNFLENFDPDERLPDGGGSQVEQDKLVAKLLNGKKNGFFLDIAANDWSQLSNTLLLERHYNWTGICVEPNPRYHAGILSNRKCFLVVNPVFSYSNILVNFTFKNGVSGGIVQEEMDNADVREEITTLLTVTLQTLLEAFKAPRVIDYISLDIEGGEFHAMKNFDFGRYKFMVMSIERPKEHLHHLLCSHGYRPLAELGVFGERIYVHHSLPGLEEHMAEYQSEEITC